MDGDAVEGGEATSRLIDDDAMIFGILHAITPTSPLTRLPTYQLCKNKYFTVLHAASQLCFWISHCFVLLTNRHSHKIDINFNTKTSWLEWRKPRALIPCKFFECNVKDETCNYLNTPRRCDCTTYFLFIFFPFIISKLLLTRQEEKLEGRFWILKKFSFCFVYLLSDHDEDSVKSLRTYHFVAEIQTRRKQTTKTGCRTF